MMYNQSQAADVTNAKVNGTIRSGLTLKFDTEKELLWFLLKWV